MLKKIIIVTIISIFLGVAYVYVSNFSLPNTTFMSNQKTQNSPSSNPTPTPLPTLPPLDRSSNLIQENQDKTPEDFLQDFKKLKDTVSSF